MEHLINCPVCGMPISKKQNTYFCVNKHNFDIAKEGYVNMLMCNQKNSKNPGDSKEMLIARQAFLNGGAYFELLKVLVSIIQTSVLTQTKIVEAGCGEGYYISNIKERLPNYNCYGLDISKDAIKMATKRNKEVNFYVASSYKTYIKSQSVGCILVIFAPFVEQEFSKILDDNGIIVVVKPRQDHLLEIKNCFYSDIYPKEDANYELFKVVKSYSISYDMDLTEGEIINLFKMTPFYHQVGEELKNNFLINPPKTKVKADFLIEVLKKNKK